MKGGLRKVEFVCFILGFFLFAILVRKLGWNQIVGNLHKTGWYFLLILLPALNSRVFSTLTLFYICKKKVGSKTPSLGTLFSLTLTACALRDAIPVIKVGGEIYKGFVLSKSLGGEDSSQIVVQYNITYLLSHFALFYLGIILSVFLLGLKIHEATVVIGVLSLILFVFFFGFFKFGDWLVRLPIRMTRGRVSYNVERITAFISTLKEYLKKKPREVFVASFIFFVGRVLESFEIFFIVTAVGKEISFPQAVILDSMSILINSIFFVFPYSAGVKELGLSFLFGKLDFPSELGIYAALMNRTVMVIFVFIGLIAMLLSGMHKATKQLLRNQKKLIAFIFIFFYSDPLLANLDTQKHLKALGSKPLVTYSDYEHPYLIVQSAAVIKMAKEELLKKIISYLKEDSIEIPGSFSKGKPKKLSEISIRLPKNATSEEEGRAIEGCKVSGCKIKLNTKLEKARIEKAEDKINEFQKIISERLLLYFDKRELPGYEDRTDRVPYVKGAIQQVGYLVTSFKQCNIFMTQVFWEQKTNNCKVEQSFLRSSVERIRPDKLRPTYRLSEVIELSEGEGSLFFEVFVYSNHYFDSVTRIVEIYPEADNKKARLIITDVMEIDELARNAVVRFLFKSQMQSAILGFQKSIIGQIES